jgi:hypothetical protein
LHLLIGYFDALGVVLPVEAGADAKACVGPCVANEVQNRIVVDERLSRPVFADRAKEAMFDGIPLRGAGRKVADLHMQTEVVTKRNLELMFPQSSSVAVAASAVSQDKQVVGMRILLGSDLKAIRVVSRQSTNEAS